MAGPSDSDASRRDASPVGAPAGPETSPAAESGPLFTASFLGLVIAAGLGALNDNIFRWSIVGISKHLLPEEYHALVLAIGSIMLVAPFLPLASPAGWVADRFSKGNVVGWVKFAEILIMSAGALAIWAATFCRGPLDGSLPPPAAPLDTTAVLVALFAVLAVMGAQSAFFGPVKYGGMAELVPSHQLASANGVMALVTYVAIIFGTLIGNLIAAYWIGDRGTGTLLIAGTIVGVAAAGYTATFFIRRDPAANPHRRLSANLFAETFADFQKLWSHRPLLLAALAAAYFWSLGALATLIVDDYGGKLVVPFGVSVEAAERVAQNPALAEQNPELRGVGLSRAEIGPIQAILAIGIGIGSVLAGLASAGRIELGQVAVGAFGMAASCVVLWWIAADGAVAFVWAALWLALLGLAGGLYDVPLAAYLQDRCPPENRGAVIAVNNFMTFSGVMLMSALYPILRNTLGLSVAQVFLVAGLVTFVVFAVQIYSLTFATARFVVGLIVRLFYRVRVYGADSIPDVGPALLISNHVTYADALMLSLASPRKVRMMAYAPNLARWPLNVVSKWMGVIPIDMTKGPKAIVKSLQAAREVLLRGEVVCIFAEGQLTRTGHVLGFQRGFTKVVGGTGAPIIPVYLDELWGSIFSYRGGKFFWKMPARWPYPVSIHFGPRMPDSSDVHAVRQQVLLQGAAAVERRKDRSLLLPRLFVRQCRKNLRKEKVDDSTGQSLTGGQLLLRTLILARVLKRHVLAKDEAMVGVLLPPSTGGVLANTALAMLKRTAVNLNYSASPKVMNACIAQCKIKHVLTSRKVLDKLGEMKLDAELVFLEDLAGKRTKLDEIQSAAEAFALPAFVTERLWGLTSIKPEDPLTVVFTSGSTGDPKGVVLTQMNVAANVYSMDQLVQLKSTDSLLGVLPFFHSFGFTITLWTVLALDPRGAYHFSPLDARAVGKLCKKAGCTIFMATPTFLRGYLKRCEKDDFATLDLILVGAEKLPEDVRVAMKEKFDKELYEGYGMTEMSPLVSVNVPDYRAQFTQKGSKPGSVGRPIPNVAARVVDVETGQELGYGKTGMLHVKGPNLMAGYLNRPDLTAEKIVDGWYVTGDLAEIDEEGFVTITGRLSRFSKIGGEMVPHGKIEDAIHKLVAKEGELKCVVTAVADDRKGERIIVLHTEITKSPDEIRKALADEGFPNLWIPARDSFFEVGQIPVLGSGKVALSDAKTLAEQKVAEREKSATPAS